MSLSATLRTLAIVFLVVGLLACTLISLPDQAYLDSLNLPKTAVSGDNSKTLGQAMRTAPFWLLFLSIFFINGTWNMLTPLIKGLGVERGLSESLAVLTVSLTGLTNAIGRLGMATISDKIGRANALYFLGVLTIACALVLIFAPSYLYMIVVLVTAFAYGGPAAVNPAFSTDFFGPKYSGSNYGVIMLALGFSSIVFNALSNNLYAATGAYTLTFIVGALTALASIVCTAVIVSFQKKLAR
jgi:OFA family oxalate/formate antiporter-like MFS transporter